MTNVTLRGGSQKPIAQKFGADAKGLYRIDRCFGAARLHFDEVTTDSGCLRRGEDFSPVEVTLTERH